MTQPFAPHYVTSSTAQPRRFGIRMDGCQLPLEHLIRQHSATLPVDHRYTLIEIGSAGCVTLRAFSDILSETRGDNWRTIGFDLTPDKAWSVDMAEVKRSFEGLPLTVLTVPIPRSDPADTRQWAPSDGMTLLLSDDPRTYLRDHLPVSPDFTFIDGCHGACAGRDFEAVEAKVAPGGLVVFHDYGEAEQGTDFQEHCREFISVRSYVHRLGLNHPTSRGGLRKGWRWIGEIAGSRTRGGDGNSAAVVQRTDESLEHQPHLSID